jgi:hypothetical protein
MIIVKNSKRFPVNIKEVYDDKNFFIMAVEKIRPGVWYRIDNGHYYFIGNMKDVKKNAKNEINYKVWWKE